LLITNINHKIKNDKNDENDENDTYLNKSKQKKIKI
jgi:hypothetical protein